MISAYEKALLQTLVPETGSLIAVGSQEDVSTLASLRPAMAIGMLPDGQTLDDFCHGQGIRRAAMINVDLAGGEIPALRGAVGMLMRKRMDLIRFACPRQPAAKGHGGQGQAGEIWMALAGVLEPYGFTLLKVLPDEFRVVKASEPADPVPPESMLALCSRFEPAIGLHRTKIDLPIMFERHRIHPRGVIHVGAHRGQELELYMRAGFRRILLIEANPKLAADLIRGCGINRAIQVVPCAISDRDGAATLRITSDDECSSLLPLKNHLRHYPMIRETGQIEVPTRRLDSLLRELRLNPADFNLLHLDIQGAELLALQGATQLLQHVDVITVEVNFEELYAGAPLSEDIDDFLAGRQFNPAVIFAPSHPSWADALYVHTTRQP